MKSNFQKGFCVKVLNFSVSMTSGTSTIQPTTLSRFPKLTRLSPSELSKFFMFPGLFKMVMEKLAAERGNVKGNDASSLGDDAIPGPSGR